jgi:hypothetical protein
MQQLDIAASKNVFIPIKKSILFTTRKYKANPEGRSIYRNAVLDWFYLKRISEIEAVGIERDLTGLPVMEVPEQLLSTKAKPEHVALRRAFETMLGQIRNNERAYALIPSEMGIEGNPTGYRFRLMSTGGARQFDLNTTKLYYKNSILQASLAMFIQLGTASAGSFALASSQTNLFSVSLGTILDNICNTFNKYAIEPLMQFNNCPMELCPKMVHGDIETPPLAEIGAYVMSLANAGQLPEDDAIKRKLLEYAKLPMPELEEGIPTEGANKAPMRGVPNVTSINVSAKDAS